MISTAGNITQEQERGIRDGLARDFGIEEKNCQLLMGKDEQTTLAGDRKQRLKQKIRIFQRRQVKIWKPRQILR